MLNEKFNKQYKGKKKIKKNVDKNRIYAFILLGLFIFWTIASILGISAFTRQRKEDKVVSASAEESDSLFINLIDSHNLSQPLYDYEGVSFGAIKNVSSTIYYNDGVPFIHINKYETGICMAFSFSSLSTKIVNGHSYCFMYAVRVSQLDDFQCQRWYTYDDDYTYSTIPISRRIGIDNVGYVIYATTFYYYGDSVNADNNENNAFALASNTVFDLTLSYCQLYLIPSAMDFDINSISIQYLEDMFGVGYEQGYNDGVTETINKVDSTLRGIFYNSSWQVLVNPASNGYVTYEGFEILDFNGMYFNAKRTRVDFKKTIINLFDSLSLSFLDYQYNGIIFTMYDLPDILYELLQLRLEFSSPKTLDYVEGFNICFVDSADNTYWAEFVQVTDSIYDLNFDFSALPFDEDIVRLEIGGSVARFINQGEVYLSDNGVAYSLGLDFGYQLGVDDTLRQYQSYLDESYLNGFNYGNRVGYDDGYAALC